MSTILTCAPWDCQETKHHGLLEKVTHKTDLDIDEEVTKSDKVLGDTVFEKYVK